MIKRIVLKDGAPPLDQLKKELRFAYVLRQETTDYADTYNVDGSEQTLIGHPVENVLDAVNEERLMMLGGENDVYEIISGAGDWDEVGSVDTSQVDWVEWLWVLVDENGTVWSEVKEIDETDATEYEKKLEQLRENAQR